MNLDFRPELLPSLLCFSLEIIYIKLKLPNLLGAKESAVVGKCNREEGVSVLCTLIQSLAFSEAGVETPGFPFSLAPYIPSPLASDPLLGMVMGDTESFPNLMPQEMPRDPLAPAPGTVASRLGPFPWRGVRGLLSVPLIYPVLAATPCCSRLFHGSMCMCITAPRSLGLLGEL